MENFEFSGISLGPGKIRKFSCNFIGAQGFKKKIFSDNFALILNSRQAKLISCAFKIYYKYIYLSLYVQCLTKY